ncbi:hypothetical protein BFJ63_vAg17366 [Fusarium oxysporum f. sp. narcissi]|uniref:ABC transporter domain-containing protein n=1 Tax=Fusarium oxysporum f. sp. narcissi TaxID=451672 RepID=A0A4Q2V643_FUSOX|nr:hypothetical protein BFJ63_vAg17366 [Fusarium oxysporum f. sp. narcissi]
MDVYTCCSAVSILMFLYYLVARSKQIRAQNYNTATFVWLLRVKLLTSISILVAANACEMSTDTTFAFDLLIIILLFYQTLDFSQPLEEGFAWVACRGTWSLMAVHDLLAISELALLPHPSMLVPACILLGICQFCISLTLSVLLLSSRSLQPAATTPDEIGHPITNKIRAAGGHWQWIKQFRLFLSWTYPEGPVEWTCVVASIALTVLEALLETWLPDIGVDAFDKHQQNRLSLLNLHAFITFLACDGAIYFVHTCFWTAQNVHRSFRAQQKINRRLMDVEEACLNQHSPRELKDTHRVSSVIPTMLDFLPLRVIPQVIKLVHVTSYLLRHYGSRVTLILLASAVLHTMAQYHAAQTDYSNSNAFDEVTGQWKVHQDDMIEGRSTIRLHGSADSMLGELDAFALKRIQIQATNNNFFRRTGAQSGLFKFISGIIAINLLADREGPMLYLQILNGHLHNLVLTLLGLPHDISVRLTQIETARIVMKTPSEMQFGTKKLQRGPGRIEFVNVSFDHIRGGEVIPVFKDLSLAIEAGSTTAFVGESGIGKSTLLKLLTREANPKSGSITIDGQDIQALKQYE